MARNISRVGLLCVLLTLAAGAEGCQSGGPTWDLALVEGTVTKDGQPMRDIEVVFLADLEAGTQGPQASGRTDEAGRYRLRTDNGDVGAVVGRHRILICDSAEVAMKQIGRALRGRQPTETVQLSPEMAKSLEELKKRAQEMPRVASRYAHFAETPLRVAVQPGPQVIDLEVK